MRHRETGGSRLETPCHAERSGMVREAKQPTQSKACPEPAEGHPMPAYAKDGPVREFSRRRRVWHPSPLSSRGGRSLPDEEPALSLSKGPHARTRRQRHREEFPPTHRASATTHVGTAALGCPATQLHRAAPPSGRHPSPPSSRGGRSSPDEEPALSLSKGPHARMRPHRLKEEFSPQLTGPYVPFQSLSVECWLRVEERIKIRFGCPISRVLCEKWGS